jgi:hypothetical protein
MSLASSPSWLAATPHKPHISLQLIMPHALLSLSSTLPPQGREPTLFTCFVAAVVLSQKRRILEDCRDADDLMRLFHSLRFIDFPACLHKAHQLRAMCSSKLK